MACAGADKVYGYSLFRGFCFQREHTCLPLEKAPASRSGFPLWSVPEGKWNGGSGGWSFSPLWSPLAPLLTYLGLKCLIAEQLPKPQLHISWGETQQSRTARGEGIPEDQQHVLY